MTEIVRIPFHLDADQQIRKLQRQPWACTVVTTVQVDGQRRMIGGAA